MATAESLVAVTQGSGKNLHTISRTVGGQTVEDEVTLPGIPYMATYSAEINAASVATAASHVIQIMAGASLAVWILDIRLWQNATVVTAGFFAWTVRRLTTAGTGGTSVTAVAHDATDAAAGATIMTLPTAKGTEGGTFMRQSAYFTQTPGAAGVNIAPVFDLYGNRAPLIKPIRVPNGTANGLAIRNETGLTNGQVNGVITWAELANF